MVLNYDFPFPKDPDNKNDRDAVQVDAIKGVGRDSQLSVRTVNGTFFCEVLIPDPIGIHGQMVYLPPFFC